MQEVIALGEVPTSLFGTVAQWQSLRTTHRLSTRRDKGDGHDPKPDVVLQGAGSNPACPIIARLGHRIATDSRGLGCRICLSCILHETVRPAWDTAENAVA